MPPDSHAIVAQGNKSGTPTPLSLDGSGNLNVNVAAGGGSGGTSANFGGSFPGTGTAAGFKDNSGNMAGANLDASGNLKVSGTLSTTPPAAGTPAQTSVNSSASNVTLLSANASRLAFTFYNDSTQVAYVKLGATASVTSYTKQMLPGEFWTTAALGVNYTGRIDALWAAANGAMRITELTA